MKKVICIIFIFALLCNLVACTNYQENISDINSSDIQDTTSEAIITEIELTKDNIEEYINFDGSFVDGAYEKSLFGYTSKATLDFQAYPLASGEFNNVEITLIVSSTDFAFTCAAGEEWHLSDASDDEKDNIKITFKLGIDGRFEKKYNVICLYNSAILDGNSNFYIVSVKGTFTPNN